MAKKKARPKKTSKPTMTDAIRAMKSDNPDMPADEMVARLKKDYPNIRRQYVYAVGYQDKTRRILNSKNVDKDSETYVLRAMADFIQAAGGVEKAIALMDAMGKNI